MVGWQVRWTPDLAQYLSHGEKREKLEHVWVYLLIWGHSDGDAEES